MEIKKSCGKSINIGRIKPPWHLYIQSCFYEYLIVMFWMSDCMYIRMPQWDTIPGDLLMGGGVKLEFFNPGANTHLPSLLLNISLIHCCLSSWMLIVFCENENLLISLEYQLAKSLILIVGLIFFCGKGWPLLSSLCLPIWECPWQIFMDYKMFAFERIPEF